MIKLNKDWKFKEVYPEISAYTTTYNCVSGGYPLEESIESFSWCDKIIVIEGGSTDGTLEKLNALKEKMGEKLEIVEIPIDLEMPGKDGYQKSMGLAMCSTPFAIQFDVDEICKGDPKKWKKVVKDLGKNTHILNMPVLEPIGELGNIRTNPEHTCWKWRVFRVLPELSHGIPEGDRLEKDGKVYSRGGSDGCTPVHIVTNQAYPSILHESSKKLLELKNSKNWEEYRNAWLNLLENNEPYIHHLGHVDLKKKIRHYLDSWRFWWANLYNKDAEDPKNNVYFPGIEFSKIDEKMIDAKVKEIVEKTPSFKL